MREIPPGFDFHRGFEGAILGFGLVFVIKIVGTISRLIKWEIVPSWTYISVNEFERGVRNLSQGISRAVGQHIAVSGSFGGALPSFTFPDFATPLVAGVGFPVQLLGFQNGTFFEQLITLIGFWIAIGFPLWFWVGRPALFWWKDRSDRRTP